MKNALILVVFSLAVSSAAIANNGKTVHSEKPEPPKSQNQKMTYGSLFFSLFEVFVPDTTSAKASNLVREEKEKEAKKK